MENEVLNRKIKRMVYMNKKKQMRTLGEKLMRIEKNNNLLWREVGKSRREVSVRSKSVSDKSGRKLVTKNEIWKR